MKITTESIEFKELCINDPLFFDNRFWKKIEDRRAVIVSSIHEDEIGVEKQFTGNCTVKIVVE